MGRSWRSGGVATVFPFAVLPDPVLGQQALDIGTEAYIYGYPLATMEMTCRVMSNTARPDLPAGVTESKSPANLVWIIGRTYCTGTRRITTATR